MFEEEQDGCECKATDRQVDIEAKMVQQRTRRAILKSRDLPPSPTYGVTKHPTKEWADQGTDSEEYTDCSKIHRSLY